MKTEFLKNLSLADLELLEGEEGEIKKRDANGIETGDIESFVRILVAFRFETICYGTILLKEGGDVYEEKNIRFDENRVFEKFVSGRFRTLGR